MLLERSKVKYLLENRGGWSTGDTYNMAIGQGFVTATPLQIAGMMAILATKGQLFRPYMIEKISNLDGQEEKSTQPFIKKTVVLKDSTWDSITRSLENVVTQGTGQASFVSYLDIHGKTGTAQNPHGEDHAWFAGYAGYKDEKPSVAVCVFVENGGHGGAIAAPIVKRILESLFPLKPETVKSS
jgi:penicillin-binding protein 2